MSPPKEIKKAVSPAEQELAAARELVRAARARGVALTGPDGLLKAITKTVLTEAAGEVEVQVPRDRAGTFDPVVVRKRQRRLSDVDAVAISLYAKGLTTGEISAHFAEVYGASVSKGRYTVTGDLTVKGATRPVALQMTKLVPCV